MIKLFEVGLSNFRICTVIMLEKKWSWMICLRRCRRVHGREKFRPLTVDENMVRWQNERVCLSSEVLDIRRGTA